MFFPLYPLIKGKSIQTLLSILNIDTSSNKNLNLNLLYYKGLTYYVRLNSR